jgi:hypothetical protein
LPTGGFGTDLNANFTFDIWVYPTTTANGTLISEWEGNPPTGWTDAQIALVSGNINAGLFDSSSFTPTNYITGPTFVANTWYNVVITYNSTTDNLKLYVGGTLISTIVGTKSNPSSTYLTLGLPDGVGTYLGGATGYFQGSLGEWKVYSSELNLSQVLANYNTSYPRYAPL